MPLNTIFHISNVMKKKTYDIKDLEELKLEKKEND